MEFEKGSFCRKYIHTYIHTARIFSFNNTLKFQRKFFAFTLAEVLIVLGIIGIVAEMTIPAVLSNVQESVLKTSFKKAYSVASQSWKMAMLENSGAFTQRGGWTCTWPDATTADYNIVDGRTDAFKSQMKVVKSCVNQAGCWPATYENYDNQLVGAGGWVPSLYSWVTADGMCWAAPWKNRDQSHIVVDTNCEKKPNKIGQDIFSLFLGIDGVIYFAIDDKSTNGRPVSSGGVCPYVQPPVNINGRSVDFREILSK